MSYCSRYFASFLIAMTLISTALCETSAFHNISWSPRQLASGSPCLFKVEVEGSPSALRGKWMGHEIVFFPGGSHVWYGLAGVDVEAKPGAYQLELEATLQDGKPLREERAVLVERAQYKTETLRVPERYVQPDAETLRRIASDKEIKEAAFAHQIAEPEWSGKFVAPIDSSVSEGFGTRRTFNGKLASIHRGLDYHAKPGTPVTAANSGEVVLARELFYEGNCVVIDHGQQFMTLYMHLSQLAVKEGEKVDKGQPIGLSGATGRATGPHLHMAVRWQGDYLDPAQLWALPLPSLPATLTSKGNGN
jgi:murein DD-endopeptidase MepM/ murein hydrolase activator NlpD